MTDERQTELRRLVDQWIEETDDWFRTDDIWRQFNVITVKGKNTVWQRLKEHTVAGRVKKRGLRYRSVRRELESIDIFAPANFVSIKFPFQLEKYIRVTDGGLIVMAGGKEAGKTGILLNTAYLNMYDWETHYFDSESGGTLLGERLLALDPDLPNPLPFQIKHCARNFSDAIVPGAFNIVDYLDLGSQYQIVGDELLSIVEALGGKGVAVVALQKPPPARTKEGKLIMRDLGYGGLPSIHRAQVALSLDPGKIKIIAAKSRTNPKVNPVNKTFTFRWDNKGANILDIKDEAGQGLFAEEELPF